MIARRLLIAAALGAFAMVPAAAQDPASHGRSLATLKRVPLKTRGGARILLGSRIQPGKPTLISIWSSWCAPCVAEAPTLNRLRKAYGYGYNFIYVLRMEGEPDPWQPPEAVTRYLANAGMSDVDYVTADIAGSRKLLGEDVRSVPVGKVGVPRVYLFDKGGRQVYASYGFEPSDGTELEKQLREAMAK